MYCILFYRYFAILPATVLPLLSIIFLLFFQIFLLLLFSVELESFLIEITSTILRRKDDLPPAEGESESDGDEERYSSEILPV